MKFSRNLMLIVFVGIVGSIGVAYAGGVNIISLNATQTNVNGNLQVSGNSMLGDSSGMSIHASDAGIDILSSGSGTFTFDSVSATVGNDFQVNGNTGLGIGGGVDVNLRQNDAGIDLNRGTIAGFTFSDTSITNRDTLGAPLATFDDAGSRFSGPPGTTLLTVDRTGETIILGDGPARNHLFVPPTGDVIGAGDFVFLNDLDVMGKASFPGGVDPPYVSFSSETHETIREFAMDVDPHEEVMIFWNTDSKQMEVYVIAQDKFYAMPLQEIEE